MLDIDLMIFDLDGTLIDSRYDIINAVNYMLKALGLKEKTFDEIVSYIGTGVRDLVAMSIGKADTGFFDKAFKIFRDYYRGHSVDQTRPYPGVIDILEHFKDKIKVIITNRDRDFARLTLSLLDLEKYFMDILGGDDQACAKPMACPVNNITAKFGIDRSRILMIGDMDIDIAAGKSAGVFTCGVIYGIGREEDVIKAGPDFIIKELSELKKIAR